MNILKDVFQSKVFKNGSWITMLQVFNTIAPMLTIPYVTRVLGASKYGVFSIALNLIFYIQVVVEYGFAMSGARKISLACNKEEIDRIYSSIMICRMILTVVSAIILALFSVFGHYNKDTIICMVLLFIMVIGTTIQLTWLFQGMQEMRPVTIISMGARIISLLLIFILVKGRDDLFLYCVLYSSTNIIYGVVGQIFARKKYKIKFQRIVIRNVFQELKDGWCLFMSSAMSKIFGNVGVTILGLVTIDYFVGIYSAISKITSVAILLFLPISQALFPYVSQLYVSSEKRAIKLVLKVMIVVVFVFGIGAGMVFIFRDSLIRIVFGNEYVGYSFLLLPLLIWMIASIVNNFLGVQILVASGREKQYSRVFLISMVFLVIYNVIFVNMYSIYGVAIAQAAAEVTLLFFLTFSIIRTLKIKE